MKNRREQIKSQGAAQPAARHTVLVGAPARGRPCGTRSWRYDRYAQVRASTQHSELIAQQGIQSLRQATM
ncbi:MAG: hypothetical protein WCA64_05660 [Gallionella sp.]